MSNPKSMLTSISADIHDPKIIDIIMDPIPRKVNKSDSARADCLYRG